MKKKKMFDFHGLYAFLAVFILFGVFSPPKVFSQNASAVDIYNQGKQAQENELYQDAIEAYKSSLIKNPKFVNPLIGLAQCYYSIEEFKEALRFVDEAKKYDKNNLSLDTLDGRIQTGLGAFDKAREQFEYVLGKEPNNLEARFGLAELDIANGKTRAAAKKYIDSLNVSPLNKTALLALARIYSSTGDIESAETYLELATKYYSNDPVVHFTAGKFYESNGNYKLALFHYKTAIDVKPLYYESILALGTLDYKQGNYADAIELGKKALGAGSSDVKYMSRYLLGLFYARKGDIADAAKNFIASLRIRNDDEVSRIAAETLVASKLPETDSIRRDLALYHYKIGKLYENNAYLSMALNEYRRALQIDPHYQDARYSYGHILKLQGYPINYLFNLKLLIDYYKSKDTHVLDDYEETLKKYYDSLTHDWESQLFDVTGSNVESPGIDQANSQNSNNRIGGKLFNQYTIRKNTFQFALFTDPAKNGLTHLEADKVILAYFRDELARSDKIGFGSSEAAQDPLAETVYVSPQSSAFKRATESNSDYFIVCKFQELERSFEVTATVYLGRTGAEIKSFNVYKTGNNRITGALAKCAQDIEAALPLRGSIIIRESNNGIIDMGRFQGVKNGDSLLIIKKGGVSPDNTRLALSYADKDVIGEMTITKVDENISLGTMKKKGIYDFINPRDEVVYPAKIDDKKLSQPANQ